MNVLAELEKDVGQIPIKSSIEYNTFGVKIEDNHVVGLGLYNKGLTSLPETIGQLTSLTELWIYNNHLKSLPVTVKNALKKLKNQGCFILGYDV
jgi:Leucine-rich repeat (LRR) protein